MTSNDLNFLIYKTPNENVSVNAIVKDETIWLTQKSMAELFQSSKSNINEHIFSIFKEEELIEEQVVRNFRTTASDGKSYNVKHYNLDMIISVGYRVNSAKATQFRIWATGVLKEYIRKGFVLDDERLKQGEEAFGKDYFKELLERVRSIRASERRIWQQITDIFAECSIDYDTNSNTAQEFYASIQNKFHYAITGYTAAEIIYNGANHKKGHMGLTTWKNAPEGRVLKSDVTIAKNYLSEKEIKRLERAVVGYFDYIEDLIENEHGFTMEEFAQSVNEFLAFRKYKILSNKGTISKQSADRKAHAEYEKFNKTQKIVSDFDKRIKHLIKQQKKESEIDSYLEKSGSSRRKVSSG